MNIRENGATFNTGPNTAQPIGLMGEATTKSTRRAKEFQREGEKTDAKQKGSTKHKR